MSKYIIQYGDGYYFYGVSDGSIGGEYNRFINKVSYLKSAMVFDSKAMANLVNDTAKGKVVERPDDKEEEKKYIVLDKEDDRLLVKVENVIGFEKHMIGRIIPSTKISVGMKVTYLLTEKEIKDYDERYWVFAKEVV